MARCQIDQLDTPAGEKAVASEEEGVRPLACKCREGRIDLTAGAGVVDLDVHSEGAGRSCHVSERGLSIGGICRIDEYGDTNGFGH